MWFVTKKIYDYLMRKDISDDKKDKIITRFKTILLHLIKEMPASKYVAYLTNHNLPMKVREMIGNEINTLSSSKEYLSNEKFKAIKPYFNDKKYYKEEYLKLPFFPNEFKKIIIDNVYDDSIVDLIHKSHLSITLKKVLVDLKLSMDDAKILLSRNISTVMRDYIIDSRINTPSEIDACLYNRDISEDIKDKIVRQKITKDNLFQVLRYSFSSERERIYKHKSKEIEELISELNENTIIETINEYYLPEEILNKIINTKLDVIKNAISTQNKKQLEDILNGEKAKILTDIILEKRPDTVYQIIKELSPYRLLSFLNLKYLPDEYKDYLLTCHSNKIDKAIKDLTLTQVTLYYLRTDSNMPLSIQEKMFNLHKESFLKEINEYSEEELLKNLRYYNEHHLVNELMIDIRINKNNIFELLDNDYLKEDLVTYLLKTKKDIFIEYINNHELKDIFRLNNRKIPSYIRNRIIDENKDLILEKIKDFDKETLYEKLNDNRTLKSVKKVILQSFGIDENDISDCMELLTNGNAKDLLENFSTIKDFIEKSKIDFASFLQYGSGSNKHSNWIENVTTIIKNNQIDEFIKCKEYFDNYYYDEDKEKENSIYTISNYLELIDNFNKYYNLCMNMTNDNKTLSKEDKLNISFLFNINNTSDLEVPNSLEELSKFKMDLYQGYITRIKEGHISEFEVKDIFNDLLFCNAKEILEYIGGTGALRTLKKDNSNSKVINDLTDELMLYSTIIEMVNDSNNREGLKKVLEYTFSDINVLSKMQNLFSEFDKKVLKLYELDSKNNLTSIERVKEIEGVYNRDLSEKYGGEVYDFSNKNYCLYAHVLSHTEDIENMLRGQATGRSNFISVSPISYRGQKYYWGRAEVILAYDNIPSGSFVCSSIHNMGSNRRIRKNSSEVDTIQRIQRGILETSAVTENNSEALLYREGLKPCGLILPGGREPTKVELEYHQKYGLPFIITQEINKAIENPQMVLDRIEDKNTKSKQNTSLLEILNMLKPNISISKENSIYTGREVAIFTDCHSMYEPTLAVLEDIRRNGIDEIYSLGDNVGLGPNPSEVFDLLEEYNVKSVAGNSEYYNTLGLAPFPYFYKEKIEVQEWTERQLGPSRISKLKLFPASIDLFLGDQKLALCHFANDCRWDFRERSTHTYQANFYSGNASEQFAYTNSDECNKKINDCITSYKKGDPHARGYISSKNEPLFQGKKVTDYDAIIQGHVHFHMEDELEDTKIHTLRAVGMGYEDDEPNSACYYVLKERKDKTFDIERRLVPFNKNSLLSSIYTSGLPNKELVLRYVKTSKDK
ncbi:MAG: metallophosphoesterase [Firmicutes bacterium]|nr:metallophosphoesterase [Bacillota bacterium]